MKKILFISILLFLTQFTFGQIIPQKIPVLNAGGGSIDISGKVDEVTMLSSKIKWPKAVKVFFITLPSSLKELDMNSMKNTGGNIAAAWTAADVNTFLQYMNGLTFAAGAKVLRIIQYNAATPSGAGATAASSLTSKGWTITTD